jgi:dCTP deaminase
MIPHARKRCTVDKKSAISESFLFSFKDRRRPVHYIKTFLKNNRSFSCSMSLSGVAWQVAKGYTARKTPHPMALSDTKILEHMKAGTIVVEPFVRENLATSSYDVTLGEWYFREKRPEAYKTIFNIYSKEDTAQIWGTKPERAVSASVALKHFNVPFDGISADDKVILLEPGETILAHTNEFIGGRESVTTMMKARSSLGRDFINVCKCAGWGDVGYINRWTMEISNSSRNYIIPLVVGRRIAQIVFFDVGQIEKNDYSKTGKYQTTHDEKKLKKSWKPEMMLPKLWNDRDIKKV